MYGELNFNPSLFVAQMKYLIPLTIGVFVALFIWGTYNEYRVKKMEKENESHI